MADTESSRIFVRGLPPTFTDDEFQKHFAKYPVTDTKLFQKRRIGYVGYKTPEDAAKAVKYFNKSFIRMSKIYVEIARPVSRISLTLHRICADMIQVLRPKPTKITSPAKEREPAHPV